MRTLTVTNSKKFTITRLAPTYVLRMFIVDESVPEYIPGSIILDGVRYSIPKTGYRKTDLPAGRHTIQVVIPSGWEFSHWVPGGEVTVDDVNANPTGITTTGNADMIAWIRRIRIPPDDEIVKLEYPSSAKPGDSVSIDWRVHNKGQDTYFSQWFRIVDLDTGEELKRLDFGLPNCGSVGLTWTFTMPDRDWKLQAEAGYEGTVTATAPFTIGLPVSALEWLPIAIAASAPALVIGGAILSQEIKKVTR